MHAPDPLNLQDVGHCGRIFLYTSCTALDPSRGVLFEMRTTRMIQMFRTVIIEYAHWEHTCLAGRGA